MMKNFFSFLVKDKLSFFSFIFLFLIFLFLPGQGDLWQLETFWKSPKVKAVEFLLPELPLYPESLTQKEFPTLSAKAYFIFDPVSGVVLASKAENLRLAPASTTKIMTALVSQEVYLPNQILTVPDFFVEGQKAKFVKGEEISAENLLIALLVGSANDAAEVLARDYPEGREAFVRKMNEKARQFSLDNTYFINPTGIDEVGHFSTARDLARLSRLALTNQNFAQIVSYPRVSVANADGKITHSMLNINELLAEVPGVKGVKTGWTDEAGECLVTLVERDGEKIISVVLGSEDRFGETKKIINWVYDNFAWRELYSIHFGSTAGT